MIQIVKARVHSTRGFWSEIMIALLFQKVLCDLEVFLKREQKWGMLFSNSSPRRHHFLKYGPFASVSHTGRKPCCNSVLPFLCRSQASGPVLPQPHSGPSSWRGSRASEPKAPRAGYPPDPTPTGPQPAGASTAGLPMGRRLRQGEGEAVGPESEGETMDTFFFFFIETSLTHSVGFCRAEFHASGMWGVGGFQGLA